MGVWSELNFNPPAEPLVEVNGRRYAKPRTKTAVICLDGVDPDYLDNAFERRLMPRLSELVESGASLRGQSQMPSFTNPNNVSIVTGVAPAVHGIPGNHYLDPSGQDVQLDRAEFLRARSIHAAFADAGTRVLAVTTKEKLRLLLGNHNVPCISAEHADRQSLPGLDGVASSLVATPKPDIYDWDCSHYALELGLELSRRLEIELLYVSLTDSVQHASAPGGELSDLYLRRLDELVGAYLDGGWRLGLVADHGMNDKVDSDGQPNVRYLADTLEQAGVKSAHVVLPITDPYVVHHAALGSLCWVHVDEDERDRARRTLEDVAGVEQVLDRDDAALLFMLPSDRIGDLIVLGDATTVFGTRASDHDLSKLRGPLRSHGGRHEQEIPILLSEDPRVAPGATFTNADIHSLVLGGPS
ncbi:MAG TPA: alkaline phosphatase family protein [Gaiellaceae bacterium]|nr:alkaline phosphatase family protein [Gaiellaceae bacterium]